MTTFPRKLYAIIVDPGTENECLLTDKDKYDLVEKGEPQLVATMPIRLRPNGARC